MARKKNREEGGGYSWMDTYGDMVTLLLTFFVLLFASSTIDAEKFSILVRAFSNAPVNADTAQIAPPGDGDQAMPMQGEGQKLTEEDLKDPEPIDIDQLYEYLKAYIEQNKMQDSVKVEKGPNSVYLRFDNNIFFDGDSAVLRPASYDTLDFVGQCIKSVEDKILFVRINGHTAAVPEVENYAVNDWDLSSTRASRVASYFEGVSQFSAAKLMTNGYGKNYPIATNSTPEGRAKNRRVDLMVLGNEFDTGNADEVYEVLKQLMSVEMFEDKSNASDIITPEADLQAQAELIARQEMEQLDDTAEPEAQESPPVENTPPAENTPPEEQNLPPPAQTNPAAAN